MADQAKGRVAIDDVFESATAGVFRALEARKIAGDTFTRQNGFFVKIDITAGGWPGPIENVLGGGLTQPRQAQPGG